MNLIKGKKCGNSINNMAGSPAFHEIGPDIRKAKFTVTTSSCQVNNNTGPTCMNIQYSTIILLKKK